VVAQYLCYCKGKYRTLKEGLAEYCDKLNINQDKLLIPTQNLYLAYMERIYEGFIVFYTYYY